MDSDDSKKVDNGDTGEKEEAPDKSKKKINLNDFSAATLKMSLPKEEDSEIESVEKIMGLKAIELPDPPLPTVDKLEEEDRWGRLSVRGFIKQQKLHSLILVRDEEIHRFLVAKVLMARPDLEEDQMQRFLDEAQILGQLSHPVIPKVHDIGLDSDGQMYFTMPYIHGKKLSESLGSERNVVQMLHCFIQICRGIGYLHDQGVWHRNLHPENIFIDSNQNPYLLGWSSSRAKNRGIEIFDQTANQQLSVYGQLSTADGRQVGDLKYMSPELICEKIRYIDERADIYALGAILFRVMVGNAPFQASTLQETISMICEKKRKIPRKNTRFEISSTMAHIIMKAMAIERGERYQSAFELVADIEDNILTMKTKRNFLKW